MDTLHIRERKTKQMRGHVAEIEDTIWATGTQRGSINDGDDDELHAVPGTISKLQEVVEICIVLCSMHDDLSYSNFEIHTALIQVD